MLQTLRAATAVSRSNPVQLAAELQEEGSRARRQAAHERLAIMRGWYKPLAFVKAAQMYKQPAVFAAVALRLKNSPNWMRSLAKIRAVAYKRAPTRLLNGAKRSSQDAFARVLRQAQVRTRAKTWERAVFAANVAIVMPVVRRSKMGARLDYDILLLESTEVWHDESDPRGSPVAAAVELINTAEPWKPSHVAMVIDDRAFYMVADGRVVRTIPHNAGVFPGVAFRVTEDDNDWWVTQHGKALQEHTLEATCIQARMDWVRFGQDRFKENAVSEEFSKIKAQVAGAEGPVEIPVPPDAFRYQVHSVDQVITNFREHIIYHGREAARSIDVPPDLLDFREGAEGIEAIVAAHQHEAVAELRTSDLDWYMESERELAWKTALVLRGARHPDAIHLRPDEVKERFRVDFPELTFVEHPKTRLEVAKQRIDLGLSSTVSEYAAFYDVPMEQAHEEVIARAREEIELGSLFAEHNVPRNSDDRKSNLAQLQGRIGGMMSGETRQNDDKDDEDDDGPGDTPGGGQSEPAARGTTSRKRQRRRG